MACLDKKMQKTFRFRVGGGEGGGGMGHLGKRSEARMRRVIDKRPDEEKGDFTNCPILANSSYNNDRKKSSPSLRNP